MTTRQRRARIPDKILWNLEDIIFAADQLREAYRELKPDATFSRNNQKVDRAWLRLSDALAEIEKRARDAKNGVYSGNRAANKFRQGGP